MKKINSLHSSIFVLKFIIIFLIIIPVCCLAAEEYTGKNLLLVVGYTSVAAGGFALFCLMIIWIIEFLQDRYMNKFYTERHNTKMKLNEKRCECQSCGSRLVRLEDRNCLTCGIEFRKGENVYVRPEKWYLR